jgi:hypothetical protein
MDFMWTALFRDVRKADAAGHACSRTRAALGGDRALMCGRAEGRDGSGESGGARAGGRAAIAYARRGARDRTTAVPADDCGRSRRVARRARTASSGSERSMSVRRDEALAERDRLDSDCGARVRGPTPGCAARPGRPAARAAGHRR